MGKERKSGNSLKITRILCLLIQLLETLLDNETECLMISCLWHQLHVWPMTSYYSTDLLLLVFVLVQDDITGLWSHVWLFRIVSWHHNCLMKSCTPTPSLMIAYDRKSVTLMSSVTRCDIGGQWSNLTYFCWLGHCIEYFQWSNVMTRSPSSVLTKWWPGKCK